MKLLLILGICLLIAIPALATIKGQNVNGLVTRELKQVRRTAINARNALNVSKAKMQALNASYGAELDADDKTKLTSVFADIVTAASELDDLGINIDMSP